MASRTILRFLVLCYLLAIGQSGRILQANDNSTLVPANDDNDNGDDKKPFTLEEIYDRFFFGTRFNGTWISDTEILIPNYFTNDIMVHDVATGEMECIFEGWRLPAAYRFNSATISADRRYILFGYDTIQVFRHSTLANYVVYDLRRRMIHKLADGADISLAIWSPTNSDIVYVQDNDIYHASFENARASVRRLTENGVPRIVYNGNTDWVYEEEVFSSATAMWYSPDGQHLAFATFNDTAVKDIAYLHYGIPGALSDQYPMEVKIKYPKVGTPNPIVTLSVIDLSDPSSKAIGLKAPVDVLGSDHILFTVNWWQRSHLVATWANRVQNKSQIVLYDVEGGSKLILSNEETEGWLQPNRPIKIDKYVLLLRLEDSGTSAGRFQHITRYEYKDGRLISPVDLTPGPSEVHMITAIDFLTRTVYYLATAPGQPNQRNLYSVALNASEKPTCISCEMLTPEGNKCTYVNAQFSRLRSYYALGCFGPDPITVRIYNRDHQQVRNWTNNELLRTMLKERLMPQQSNFNITVNGYDSRVRLLLPPDFDEKKSYPLLVHVYGGPNSVRITDVLKFDYEFYLTTNKRIVYAWIDGRGSAFKGSKMLFEIYRHIGTVEIEDTIAVTAALQQRYDWIDRNRTGIWGWSYGGFTTAMTLATDTASVFKCGISVAPVTSWIYYDSIYTERYMGLPTAEDNLAGYNRTDVSRLVEGIRGKRFMLIHGSGDDNVHYQQAMALAKSLERSDILFQQITYTDETHALENVHPHFYHTMDKFWDECFGLESSADSR